MLAAAQELQRLRAQHGVALDFLLIDDGFQERMGDWLVGSPDLGLPLAELLHALLSSNVSIGLWLAPFIASKGSRLLREHPDWFVKDTLTLEPMSSDSETFGGWRDAPWYALDACHPQVLAHLEGLFRYFRDTWHVRYFKLDALFWGALHNGARYSDTCTRIEAYRLGMKAMRRGAPDAYLSAANHPIWPSVGLVEASRLSSDVFRDFRVIRKAARESLLRGWQHGVLWHGDPDVVLLAEGVAAQLPLPEALFAASVVLAIGGVAQSGDVLASLSPARRTILRRLLRAPPHAAAGGVSWDDEQLRAGVVEWDSSVESSGSGGDGARGGGHVVFLFNWEDEVSVVETLILDACRGCRLFDYWHGILEDIEDTDEGRGEEERAGGPSSEDLGWSRGEGQIHGGGLLRQVLPPRRARVFVVQDP